MIEKEIVICLGLAQESSGGSSGGTSNYSDLTNKPKINGNIVVGDKTGSQLGLQNELTAGEGIVIEADQQTGETTISATGVTAIDDELSTTSELPVQNKVITNALNGKVDEETGKGLSANDFTDTLKNKLDNIESNAEVNTISTISCNNTPVSPDVNKNVNITVPVNTSDLVNDNNTVTDANYVHTDNNYTTAEKEKLANLGTASQKDFTTQITQNSEDLITSGAVYTGLGLKLDTSLKGVAEGLAELDENGKIVTSQLPASIDEIIEGYFYEGAFYQDQQHTVVITGQTNKIYVDLVSNKTYRYGGSEYVEISESLAIGETSSTAGRGDHTKTAYDHSQLVAGNPHNVTKAEVGLGNCDNTSDLNKPISTATQTALNGKIGTGLLPVAETNIKAIDSYMLASDLNITDANDIKYKYGVVCCNGQNVSHLPSTDYYNVHVEIVNNDPNKIIQTAIKNSSPVETYVRRSVDLGSTWSDWNKVANTSNLTRVLDSDYQLSTGGNSYAWFDLGTSSNAFNSQAFLFYEITYGRVDGLQSKILVSCGGTMADGNYIKIVNLNNAQTSASEQFKIDSNKHLWLGMQSYCEAYVKVYGRWSGMGNMTTTEPTGTSLTILKCQTNEATNGSWHDAGYSISNQCTFTLSNGLYLISIDAHGYDTQKALYYVSVFGSTNITATKVVSTYTSDPTFSHNSDGTITVNTPAGITRCFVNYQYVGSYY